MTTAPGAPARRLLLASELALAALTVAAAVGFVRVFAGTEWRGPVLAAAVGSHLVAAAARRLRAGTVIAGLLSGVGLVLAASWLVLGDTTTAGLPSSDTWRAAGEALRGGWAAFQAAVAPTPADPGLVLAAVAGVWVAAFLADTSAFRLGTTPEAAVPAATLFVFCAALAGPVARVEATALFLAALLGHVLAARALRQAASPTWLTTDPAAGTRALLRTGLVLGAAAVAVGVTLGPLLPGAGAEAAIPWRASDRRQDEARITVSPLVDIRSRLVQQSGTTVLTVRASERAYWRLTSLEQFDGRVWSSTGAYRQAQGDLPGRRSSDRTEVAVVDQEITVRNLQSIWLPAAFEPVRIESLEGVKYHEESGTLVTEEDTSDGVTYHVRSEVPLPSSEQLTEADVDADRTYLALPDGFSDRARSLAADVVSSAPTPYEKALALQRFFRHTGGFTYDLSVPPGHDGDALVRFLFGDRRGYCEQFAGAYAALARAVGLPARVAVGFTPGEQEGDVYRVRGRNAHAWPEVHLDGVGWVAFEPTPGRGMPGAEAYTGVPEQQVAVDDATTAASTAPAAPGGEAAAPSPTGDVPGTPGFEGLEGLDVFSDTGAAPSDQPSPWPRRLATAAVAALAALVAWVVALAVARVGRRWWRRRQAVEPAQQVHLAWVEAVEATARLGTSPHDWETPTEFARRAARRTGLEATLLDTLAAARVTADYTPEGADPSTAAVARRAAAAVATGVRRRLAWRRWAQELVDPRPLLPAARQHVVVLAAGRATATSAASEGALSASRSASPTPPP